MRNFLYEEFVCHWTAAVNGETPDGTSVNADEDGDGQVSMKEAFRFARDQDRASETPQYKSYPTQLGAGVSLCGQPN